MKLIACAVRDSAANAFMRPFFVPTTGLAIRSFSDEVNRADKDNAMYQHPEDYELFEVGDFNEETGRLTALEAPRSLGSAKQFRVGGA